MPSPPLHRQNRPCGPTLQVGSLESTQVRLAEAAADGGWGGMLTDAWPALAPVFAASPYLAGLARRWPERLRQTIETSPEDRLAAILSATD